MLRIVNQLGLLFHQIELETQRLVSFSELVYCSDDPIADISGFGYCSVPPGARAQGAGDAAGPGWR